MKSAAETYFAALADIHATGGGVAETSYYPVLIKRLSKNARNCLTRKSFSVSSRPLYCFLIRSLDEFLDSF